VDSSLQSLSGSKRAKGSTDKMGDRMLSHLHSLRAWGRQRLSRKEQQPNDLYETLAHIRRPRSTSPHVRLRTNTGRMSKRDVHSSSGNWSASSSSARASVESSSENRTTSHLPTSSSSSTCDSALSVRRPKATSVSSSNSRESPDLPVSDSTGFNDGETSSVYSCDTEGYYTSFHVDSGLKTLREEPFESTNSSGNITVCAAQISTQALSCENEYELFGKGSTSTTASSAGTICTVKAPPSPPLRKSSLENVNSDNDTVERRARVRQALGANRIPSMCAITPPLSEDEQPSRPPSEQKSRASPQLKAALLPFNSIMGKMREVLRKTPPKETPR
jgi:NHS-like